MARGFGTPVRSIIMTPHQERSVTAVFRATEVELEELYPSTGDASGGQEAFGPAGVPLDDLQGAIPATAARRGAVVNLLWWVVPQGWHTIDARLLRLFRQQCEQEGNRPLVIECRGLEAAKPNTRDQEIRRLDELALAIEELWEVAWLRVPHSKRPGLVIVRADGAVPIAADMRSIWPALKVVARSPTLTSRDIAAVAGRRTRPAPAKALISQLLQGLRRQGLLAMEAAGTRPLRYAALPAWASNRLVQRRTAEFGAASADPAAGRVLAISLTEELMWDQLHSRLCDAGLRTIGPKVGTKLLSLRGV